MFKYIKILLINLFFIFSIFINANETEKYKSEHRIYF